MADDVLLEEEAPESIPWQQEFGLAEDKTLNRLKGHKFTNDVV